MAPLGPAAGRKNLAKFLGIDMRAGTTGILTMMILVMMVNVMVRLRIMVMMTMMMMLAAKGDEGEGVLLDC